eukprot:Skav225848  [mRNA]  locus=scaffold345:174855:177317:+ [translate_table: standard]
MPHFVTCQILSNKTLIAAPLRMVHRFKVMWRLVYGLLTAAETILATVALILVFLFVFACVAVEVISKDEFLAASDFDGVRFIVSEHFGSLGKTVMTLMQFVTLDSLANVYFPLIVQQPFLLCFFLPILIFISIGLMNLVTAASQPDFDESCRSQIRMTCDRLHEHALLGLSVFGQPVCLQSTEKETEREGAPMVEFVEGLLNLCLLDMPIATIQTLKLLQLIRASINQLLALQTPTPAPQVQVQARRECTNLSKCSIRQI